MAFLMAVLNCSHPVREWTSSFGSPLMRTNGYQRFHTIGEQMDVIDSNLMAGMGAEKAYRERRYLFYREKMSSLQTFEQQPLCVHSTPLPVFWPEPWESGLLEITTEGLGILWLVFVLSSVSFYLCYYILWLNSVKNPSRNVLSRRYNW